MRSKFTMPSAMLAAVQLLSLTPATLGGLGVDLNKPASIAAAAKTVVKSLVEDYTDQNPLIKGLLPSKYSYFESGLFFNTLLDYAAFTGDNTFNTYFEKDFFGQIGSGSNFVQPNSSSTISNYDVGYWALAAISAAEFGASPANSSAPGYLDLAGNVFDDFVKRWDAKNCSGGLRESIFTFENRYGIKDGTSNGIFFELAARLGLQTGNKTYLDWATTVYDWTNSTGFIDRTSGQVYLSTSVDGGCKKFDKTPSSALQSNFIYGAAVMYNATKSSVWFDRALLTASYAGAVYFTPQKYVNDGTSQVATEQACEYDGNCSTSQKAGKSVLMRSVAAAATYDGSGVIYSMLNAQVNNTASSAAKSCNSKGECSFRWTDLEYDASKGTGVGEKMGVAEALLAASRYISPEANKQAFNGGSPPSSSSPSASPTTTDATNTAPAITSTGAPDSGAQRLAGGAMGLITVVSFLHMLL